jgi:alpha-D-ribose 1-methylphosphonate 5-triphosphate synthase subunit PhnH
MSALQSPFHTRSKHRFDMTAGTQEVFRLLLDALANPGRPVDLSRHAAQFAAHGQWLAPALTLLDNETGFFCDGIPDAAEEIRFLSGGVPVPLEAADFVFLAGERAGASCSGPVLARVKRGTLIDPHDSALLCIAAGGQAELSRTLRGPGIPPEGRELRLSAAEAAWLRARDAQGFEYPCGVELIFMRNDYSITAVTRKATVEGETPWRM